jgi:hypothetical protein
MMVLKQTVVSETASSTLSVLQVEDRFLGFIIEDGAREIKVYGQTRVPGGRYEIVPRRLGGFYRKYKSSFGHDFSIEVKDVPNFTNILIHIGNEIEDTLGCLLINYTAKYESKTDTFRGFSSTPAYLELYELIKKAFDNEQRVFIEIDR